MVWLMILGTAVVTFALRFSFLGTVKPHSLAPSVKEALRFVPAAVFAAIVACRGADPGGGDPPRARQSAAARGARALVIAWLTRSVHLDARGRMVGLWVVQWWLGG
jgi:branched-subunit amino acid transport protein